MTINQRQFALIKFFHTAQYKQDFLEGKIFCNTPAYYRKSNQEGVGDRCESAIHSYYKWHEPNDDITLRIGFGNIIGENEINLRDSDAFILRQSGSMDSWLHCWYLLDSAKVSGAILERMLEEFGEHVVILDINNFDEFLKRIRKYSEKKVEHCTIRYTNDPFQVDYDCKLESYRYQNEFRFMFGNCDFQCVEPYKFSVPEGFKDLITENVWLKIIPPNKDEWVKFLK
ncbi:hypothetical protein PEC301296_11120 [Pectobacterium carotovorum subsp. carotovorum]|nr:hypothetical protein PEC301296_11120 [Pectobacterium carotovorum subsp. carotovorum]